MTDQLEPGRCTACHGAATRGPGGAWWHDNIPCHLPAARFQPARFQPGREDRGRRQQQQPRNRQLPHPPEDR